MKVYTTEEYIKEGDSIGMFSAYMAHAEKEHRHDFIEIIYVLSGTATEKVDDKIYEVKHGDMLFINLSISSLHPLRGGSTTIISAVSPSKIRLSVTLAQSPA